eukprot:TRINITY_DN1946_c0_g1_i5.p1 TRINITY_DN1946_c0_g1~~TRINITY_DN1946_c0_g1_i5.p1  ORF type:complete len:200 (+),score=32.08 TRINITY_DN1946_c0_g1_i5:31-630(+)
MGKGEKEKDSGLFGWRDWKYPEGPIQKMERQPAPADGSYDPTDWLVENKPSKWAHVFSQPDKFNPVRYPKLSMYHSMLPIYNAIPMYKTVFTDIGNVLAVCPGAKCEKFELRATECLEYYGLKQGMDACQDWYDDLMECRYNSKTMLRVKHMTQKRQREHGLEWVQGKRDKVYEPPPKFHAYLSPHLQYSNYFHWGTTS